MQAATTDQFRFLDGLAAQQKQNPLLKVLFSKVSYGVLPVHILLLYIHPKQSVIYKSGPSVNSLGKYHLFQQQNLEKYYQLYPIFKLIVKQLCMYVNLQNISLLTVISITS